MMDNAQALLKEELYEEAKTALLAAKRLAEKAKQECDKKRKEEEERKRLEAAKAKLEPVAKEIAVEKTDSGPDSLVTVHFGFNDSSLSDEARNAMGNNAEYLGIHKKIRVQIEGHCDERGSTEYNLSLGERRAMAVKNYLVKLGVEPGRLEIISYGEERPAETGASEDAWAQNRRAEFRELE
ncbi:MAG: peptidoglycan-associated lipoprotein Pal [Deltaproteobacteria bacterium]|nr:peptidoglycan-associated lipoprotein Pal [Deltaproteobacteria bacterium]